MNKLVIGLFAILLVTGFVSAWSFSDVKARFSPPTVSKYASTGVTNPGTTNPIGGETPQPTQVRANSCDADGTCEVKELALTDSVGSTTGKISFENGLFLIDPYAGGTTAIESNFLVSGFSTFEDGFDVGGSVQLNPESDYYIPENEGFVNQVTFGTSDRSVYVCRGPDKEVYVSYSPCNVWDRDINGCYSDPVTEYSLNYSRFVNNRRDVVVVEGNPVDEQDYVILPLQGYSKLYRVDNIENVTGSSSGDRVIFRDVETGNTKEANILSEGRASISFEGVNFNLTYHRSPSTSEFKYIKIDFSQTPADRKMTFYC